MTTITNTIRSIIASFAGIPLTLESGINFSIDTWSPAEATRIFMESSPFFISMTPNGGIRLVSNKNLWHFYNCSIIEAKTFDNGYCYIVTEDGHKLHFTHYNMGKVEETADIIKMKDMLKRLMAYSDSTEYLDISTYLTYDQYSKKFFLWVDGYENEENPEDYQPDEHIQTIDGNTLTLEEIAKMLLDNFMPFD